MLHRAYSLFDVKSIDDERRIVIGIASTPTLDRGGDRMDSKGAQFTLPMPFRWEHKSVVGEVTAAHVTAHNIQIEARIPNVEEPGLLKDLVDFAWQSIKLKLARGLSIGWRPIDAIPNKYGGLDVKTWSWFETSAVGVPMNAEATVQLVKSLDDGLAASGTESAIIIAPIPARATATLRVVSIRTDTTMKKSYADQIASWEATRRSKTEKMDAILTKAADEGVTLDAAQKDEHDTLEADVKEIEDTLRRLRAAEEREKATAVDVQVPPHQRAASRITMEKVLPKGIQFARYALCVANSRGMAGESIRLAKEHYPDDSAVLALVTKAAVAGGATSAANYVGDMIPYNVMNDFIEFLRPGSIIGKFGGAIPGSTGNYPSLRRVGFNERVSGISTGYTAGWKGEGLPALPSAAVTFNTALTWNCMSALAVLTKEAIRFSNPSAEARVRDDLARAVNFKLDLDFVDPAKAASGTTSPASITNAIVATAPSGTAATNIRRDIATLLGLFATNKLDPTDLVLIMSATMAAQISMMVNALGQQDFPGLTMQGGFLAGIPVIVSEHLTSVGSPATQTIIMVKAGDVYLADDGVVTVEASDQASIEMQDSSSQSAISGTGASLVSLWQTGAVGLMANREITWKLRRSTAVQYISPAAYAVPAS